MIINYAHRGASAYAPENTLVSFRMGLEMGANGIETDLQRTRDGVLVLHHDDTLLRTAGDHRRVCECAYDELLALDFGLFMGTQYRGTPIMRFADFWREFSDKGLHLALEIKQSGIEEQMLKEMGEYDPKKTIITSFQFDAIAETRRLDDHIPIGWLVKECTPETLDALLSIRGNQICPKIDSITHETMALAANAGVCVRAWGVSDTKRMQRACDLGVCGMTVNFPDLLAAELNGRI